MERRFTIGKPATPVATQTLLYGLTPDELNAPFAHYLAWMSETDVPMLLLSFTPGVLIGEEEVAWAKANIHNLTHRELGPGVHFVQEDQPAAIGQAIADWHRRIAN